MTSSVCLVRLDCHVWTLTGTALTSRPCSVHRTSSLAAFLETPVLSVFCVHLSVLFPNPPRTVYRTNCSPRFLMTHNRQVLSVTASWKPTVCSDCLEARQRANPVATIERETFWFLTSWHIYCTLKHNTIPYHAVEYRAQPHRSV